MGASLRVVHVALSLDCGGLERVVASLARAGREHGQRVAVVCLERPGTLARRVEKSGAPVYCVHKRPGLRFETTARLEAVFRDLAPDVVHSHHVAALFYGGPAARRAGVPVVVHTEHTDRARNLKDWPGRLRARLLLRLAGRHAARFFCVSDDIAKSVAAYGSVPRRKVGVVPNGIDVDRPVQAGRVARLRRELGIPAAVPVIGTVGRLNEVKRQDLLVGGFARLRRQFPDARLLLVGDGPERAALEGLARELGVERFTHFAGYQARPEEFLRLMSVFALTSRLEGLPLALLEAWAAGLPVVATRVGGIPSVVDDGRTGVLVPSGDEPAFVAALADLLGDPDRARELGAAGRHEVRARFGLDRMADDYANEYRALLAEVAACAS